MEKAHRQFIFEVFFTDRPGRRSLHNCTAPYGFGFCMDGHIPHRPTREHFAHKDFRRLFIPFTLTGKAYNALIGR